MSTKPQLKLIPLPNWLPKLPRGAVYLGKGQTFGKPGNFTGWRWSPESPGWAEKLLSGRIKSWHYAAPSAIAREILGVREAPKKAKKAPALRKLPKNVKPGTKVVCVEYGDGLTCGCTYFVSIVTGDSVWLKGFGSMSWPRRFFRLAPEKKPRVQRSKRIGVMPAPDPEFDRYSAECDKLGTRFAAYASANHIDLPDWLPALPPVPAGFDRWEPRGMGWQNELQAKFAVCGPISREWFTSTEERFATGVKDCFYIEAVRDEPQEAFAPPTMATVTILPTTPDNVPEDSKNEPTDPLASIKWETALAEKNALIPVSRHLLSELLIAHDVLMALKASNRIIPPSS